MHQTPGVDNIPSELFENRGAATKPRQPDSDMQEDLGHQRNGRRIGHNRWSYRHQRKATSHNVRTIVPSASSASPARSFSELSSTDPRPKLRHFWQKNKQVLDQAEAYCNRSSVVESSRRRTFNIICKESWRTPRRSQRHCQHWRQKNHQSPL